MILGVQNSSIRSHDNVKNFYPDLGAIFLVFDLNDSMNTKDVLFHGSSEKVTRLAAAQRLALDLIDKTSEREVGVILMKKTGSIYVVPTRDKRILKEYILAIHTTLLSGDRTTVLHFADFLQKMAQPADHIVMFSDFQFDELPSQAYDSSFSRDLVGLGSASSAQFPLQKKMLQGMADLLGADYQIFDGNDLDFSHKILAQKDDLMIFTALVGILLFFFL
ncbi:MAG TPA: hypothetical protein PKC14_02920 [Candidatus Absconditabacterales bacterium]|nr:hypothetical protein [Candidatus Absconditabacterales bacterium]